MTAHDSGLVTALRGIVDRSPLELDVLPEAE